MYQHVQTARLSGTSNQGELEVAPRRLVEVFGPPTDESWDTESLGAYYFVGPDDLVFAVYCRAYDRSAKSIKELRVSFWRETRESEFSIGAHSAVGVGKFKTWISDQLGIRHG